MQVIPYAAQWIDESDIQAVSKVLRSSFLTQGPAIHAFERALAEVVGVAEAVAVSNGTAALHLASEALGVGPGVLGCGCSHFFFCNGKLSSLLRG